MCGIAGVYIKGKTQCEQNIVTMLVMGLHALQHRGQDSCGLAVIVDGLIDIYKTNGLIGEAWTKGRLKSLENGCLGLGQVRYPTAGVRDGTLQEQIQQAQPFKMHLKGIGGVALVHNGTITNADKYRQKILATGQKFQSDIDSEVGLRMLAMEKGSLVKRIQRVCQKLEGGFSFILITKNKLLGTRGASGFWPLVIGKKKKSFMLASETSALQDNLFKYLREVEPGEVVTIDKKGLRSFKTKTKNVQATPCIFELVYFSRPDSITFGRSVSLTRMAIGKLLAQEHPLDVDMICPMPDSGISAAIGYAQEMTIPYMLGIIRNHYEQGRSFMKKTTAGRRLKAQMKLPIDSNIIRGKRIAVVDDSLVRSNTLAVNIPRLFQAGAKEVHILIACPPIWHPCRVGIDTPTYEELFAYGCTTVKEVEEKAIAQLGATSIGFISLESLKKACNPPETQALNFCDACFTGNYPI